MLKDSPIMPAYVPMLWGSIMLKIMLAESAKALNLPHPIVQASLSWASHDMFIQKILKKVMAGWQSEHKLYNYRCLIYYNTAFFWGGGGGEAHDGLISVY